uniref:Uncharacterized protein n=1 Tax=Ixodes ricinus TaxID=34613 RepID=A0A6B0TU09_IXORI
MPSRGRGDATHLWPAVVVLSYIFAAPYMLHILLLRPASDGAISPSNLTSQHQQHGPSAFTRSNRIATTCYHHHSL